MKLTDYSKNDEEFWAQPGYIAWKKFINSRKYRRVKKRKAQREMDSHFKQQGIDFWNEPIIRYYNGKLKCKRISKITVMKTAMFEAMEDGNIGTKKESREIKKGMVFHCPVRRCFKNRKR